MRTQQKQIDSPLNFGFDPDAYAAKLVGMIVSAFMRELGDVKLTSTTSVERNPVARADVAFRGMPFPPSAPLAASLDLNMVLTAMAPFENVIIASLHLSEVWRQTMSQTNRDRHDELWLRAWDRLDAVGGKLFDLLFPQK